MTIFLAKAKAFATPRGRRPKRSWLLPPSSRSTNHANDSRKRLTHNGHQESRSMPNIHSIHTAHRKSNTETVALRERFLSALRGWQLLERRLMVATVVLTLSVAFLSASFPAGAGLVGSIIASVATFCGLGFALSRAQSNAISGLMLSLDLGARSNDAQNFEKRVKGMAKVTKFGVFFDRASTKGKKQDTQKNQAQVLSFRRERD